MYEEHPEVDDRDVLRKLISAKKYQTLGLCPILSFKRSKS
jgi:hypothetical protein